MYIIESNFVYKKFRCVVTFNGNVGCRCGYVELPNESRFANLQYNELINIDVHGGITYFETGASDYPIPSKYGWIGFDCTHDDDEQDFKTWIKYFPENYEIIKNLRLCETEHGTVKNLGFCEKECKKIVDQLIFKIGK